MKKVADETKAKLWASVGPELVKGVELFVMRGVRREKGKTQKEVLIEVLSGIVKIAYESGLDRGYDMGAEVFGDGE